MQIGKPTPVTGKMPGAVQARMFPVLQQHDFVSDCGEPTLHSLSAIIQEFRISPTTDRSFSKVIKYASQTEIALMKQLKARTLAAFDRYFAKGCVDLIDQLKCTDNGFQIYCDNIVGLEDLASGRETLNQLFLDFTGTLRAHDYLSELEETEADPDSITVFISEQLKASNYFLLNTIARLNTLLELLKPFIDQAITATADEILAAPSLVLH